MTSSSPAVSDRLSDKEASIHADFESHNSKVPIYNAHIDVSGIDERKLMWKIDRTLIPWLALLYLLSFLDRTSIGKYVVRTSLLVELANCFQQCQGTHSNKTNTSLSHPFSVAIQPRSISAHH